MSFLSCFTGTSLGYDNRGRIISYYSHNSEFIYSLSYLRNSNVLQQELYGSYRDNFANTEDLVYKFTYDKSNRLLSATNTAGSSNEYKIENSYDKDGNILALKRYGDGGGLDDDFSYQYYTGTNKLKRVSSSNDQYIYDLNGNVTTDSLNKNTSAVYDHRNLLIEIYHKRGTPPARIDYFATRYYYDEAGNRVRKLTYKNNDANAGPVLDWNNTSNPGNGWTLFNSEHYARSVDGKDLATYTNNSLDEWYVWGTDMVGKIKGNTKYYFFKDHLGSVRAVVDNNFNLVSAVDYDMWGYLMENRVYNGDSSKHKFTGKERDEENLYDYFGARYYDAKIGRWGQVEPLINKYLDLSPYVNSLNNPIIIIDPNGKDPIREQIGSQNSVIEILKANIGKSIYDVGLDIFGKDAGINSRYIYTKERGILDLQHFFAAAHQSKEWGFAVALRRGEAQEFAQLFGIFDKRSAFNPEDLSSNLQGAILGKLLESTELTSENIEIIIEFLNSLEIIDPNDPSISESKVYIPSLEEYKAGIRLPLRYTYGPYYGEAVGFNNR